jgi:hypothetical protein
MPVPIKSIRVGNVQLSLWENTAGDNVVQSITFDKSYKDGTEWKKTKSFKFNELAFLQVAIQEILKFKYLKEDVVKDKDF